jgi:hexulose-6-phosphate isomerase
MHYWSTPQGLDHAEPIEQAIRLARQHGFAGIELAIAKEGQLNVDSSQSDCERIRRLIDEAGLICQTVSSGMSWALNPVSDDPAERDEAVRLHAAALERAAWLGCEALLMVPGVVGSPITPGVQVPYETSLARAEENTRRLADVAEQVGVDLCLENVWNGMLLSPLEWQRFFEAIDSSRVGMYFDCGNLLGYHQYPPHWIQILSRWIKRIHIKDYKLEFGWSGQFAFTRLGEGDVPLAPSIEALKTAGYTGTIVAEMLPHEEGLLEHTSQVMDELLAPIYAGTNSPFDERAKP